MTSMLAANNNSASRPNWKILQMKQAEPLSQYFRPEVPHNPWRDITEQRTSGCWPADDGQMDRDV